VQHLHELADASARGNTSVEEFLKLAVAVANELHDRDAARWFQEELHGYGIPDRIPDYRHVRGRVGINTESSFKLLRWRDS
jgi:hypothetical protein